MTGRKENGRLVLSPNGKQVDVPATEALIRHTADPSKTAVAARHQQERLQRDIYSQVAVQSEPTNMATPPPADPAQGQTPGFQKARAHRDPLPSADDRDGISQSTGKAGGNQIRAKCRL